LKSKDKKIGIQQSQKICLELLQEVKTICDANELLYWIDGGTLLGAKRHGGFIPWDDDVDVCLPMHHYEILIQELAEYSKKKTNRLLYFAPSNFSFWCDYYASTDYLVDGLLPVRIDLIPIKFIENTSEAIAKDQSLFEIATLYIRGFMKHPDRILDEHKFHLPKNDNLLASRENFVQYYMEYASQLTKLNITNNFGLMNYIFNDAYVKKDRGYLSYDVVFPLVGTNDFDQLSLHQPNNKDAYLTFLYGPNHMILPEQDQRMTHQLFLIENKWISPKDLKHFLVRLHILRFKSYDISRITGHKKKYFLKLKNFTIFTISLLLKMKVSLAVSFWKYNLSHFKRKV